MAVTRAMPRSSAARAVTRGPRAALRAGARLWAVLHAPALLNGHPADFRDPAAIEDDRFRLSRRS
jgi:hypothetical protein